MLNHSSFTDLPKLEVAPFTHDLNNVMTFSMSQFNPDWIDIINDLSFAVPYIHITDKGYFFELTDELFDDQEIVVIFDDIGLEVPQALFCMLIALELGGVKHVRFEHGAEIVDGFTVYE